jgi:hypothetical protein
VCTQETYPPTYLRTYLRNYLPTDLRTYLRTYETTYLPTYLPTYETTYLPTYETSYLPTTAEHSPPWEAKVRPAAQEIRVFYGNWRSTTGFTEATPPVPNLNQTKPPTYFQRIHFNIILPSTPKFCELSTIFTLSKQHVCTLSPPASYLPIPTSLIS